MMGAGVKSGVNHMELAKTETCRLHMVTWNVGTAEPPNDISSLLQLDSPIAADLIVIGLQEVKASPIKFMVDLAFEDSWSHRFMDTLGPAGFVKITSVRMQGLLLLVFTRLAHVPFIRDIQTTYTRTGIFGYWGNKGAVSVRLSFYGHMLCFLNCHLAAHMNYAAERVDEFEYILDTQEFDMLNTPHILDHKVVFWFGDLNFRIADHGLHFLRSAINSKRVHLLWEKDQLLMMRKKEAFLQEFEEGPLKFKPTYKFQRFSEDYDTRMPATWLGFNGKKRKPAWTDRILWRVKPKPVAQEEEESSEQEDEEEEQGVRVKQEEEEEDSPIKVVQDVYNSDMNHGVSDHKPVIGTFSLELKKKFETPLVRVSPEGLWGGEHDVMVTYSILEPFPSSTWDWIGLYKVGFRSASDYITYTWVKDEEVSSSDEVMQVYLNKGSIPVLGGEFVVCYYSYNTQSIVGISNPFQVRASITGSEGLVPKTVNGMDANSSN